MRPRFTTRLSALLLLAAFALVRSAEAQEDPWPDLSSPPSIGGGEKDAAVVVGAENYAFVAKVPGARANADDWQAYLTGGLKVPLDRVQLLRDNEATKEKIRRYATKAAADVRPGGTLWFVFIGHGAPSKDGKDGLLVGADAQQDADSLYERSLPRGELLSILAKGAQARTVVLIDACFSGRSPSGEALVPGLQPLITLRGTPAGVDPRTILMTAAKSDQFAGPLPKAGKMRPAFSYLALGALRGWSADAAGKVTAGSIVEFARRALSLDKGRVQTPELAAGPAEAALAVAREAGPNLAKIDREGAPSGASFQFSDLPSVPRAQAPKALDQSAMGLDLSKVDVDALEKYDKTVNFDKGDAEPADKAANWRRLADEAPQFADVANSRAAEWDKFAQQKQAQEDARQQRIPARDADWQKLGKLLALGVVPEPDKKRWSAQFVSAYLDSPGLEPDMAKDLLPHVAPGPKERALRKILSAPPDMSLNSEPAPGEKLYTAPNGDFKVAIPESWIGSVAYNDKMYGEYSFSDPGHPSHKLYIQWMRRYVSYKTPAGERMYADAEQFADFGETWMKLSMEKNGLIEGKRQVRKGKRTFWTVVGSWEKVANERCWSVLNQICDGGTYRFASIAAGGFYVLTASADGTDDSAAADLFKEFRRTFVALKYGPDGEAIAP